MSVPLSFFFFFAVKLKIGATTTALFCSKEGAAQVRLKLGLVGDDTGHNFTFIAPQPIATTEREMFKKELTNIISRNRSAFDHPSKPPVIASSPITPTSSAFAQRSRLPSSASTPRAASVSSDGRIPILPGLDPAS